MEFEYIKITLSMFLFKVFFVCVCVELRVELRALCLLGKHSTTKLHFQLFI